MVVNGTDLRERHASTLPRLDAHVTRETHRICSSFEQKFRLIAAGRGCLPNWRILKEAR